MIYFFIFYILVALFIGLPIGMYQFSEGWKRYNQVFKKKITKSEYFDKEDGMGTVLANTFLWPLGVIIFLLGLYGK